MFLTELWDSFLGLVYVLGTVKVSALILGGLGVRKDDCRLGGGEIITGFIVQYFGSEGLLSRNDRWICSIDGSSVLKSVSSSGLGEDKFK